MFTKDVNFEDFKDNREKVLAVVKLLEILGEAVQKIPLELRQNYTSIPWGSIAGMRNLLVHEYWEIDVDVVWATVNEDVPPLKEVIIEMLAEEGN